MMQPARWAPMPAGFHAFWFWNGRITADGIRDQLAAMAAQGIRGVYLHPRQGLGQPYLSDAFLDLVETAVAEAATVGLSVHLYDEYPYPSGAAGGGVVLSDPGLAGSRLRHVGLDRPGGPCRLPLPAGRVVACLAFPRRGGHVDWDEPTDLSAHVGMHLGIQSYVEGGLGPYNDRRYFASAPQPTLEAVLPPGGHRVAAAVLVPIADHKYWGSFPDILQPKAVGRFIQLTHERYASRLRARLRAVPSIFVDEVRPWVSATVVDELSARAGADAVPLLVALGEPGHPRHLEALAAVTGIELELFERSFERPVADWCRGHGVRYAAEKPSLRLSQLRWLDVPGCEPGHVKAGAAPDRLLGDILRAPIRGNARATASAAYLYGKEGALCECYHSLGWDATLQDAKLLADMLVAMGIRWLVPHALSYCVHGLRKHDAPPSFLQMPYWRLFGLLSRHVTELWRHLDGTHPDAAIAVVDPTWGLPDEQGERCYELLQRAMVARQLDWLTVDTDILRTSRLEQGSAAVRGVRLRAVAVPPMRRVEPELARWLRDFEEGGGTVVRLAGPADVAAAADTLARVCPASLRFTVRRGRRENILCAARRRGGADTTGGARLWFLVNLGTEPAELACAEPSALTAVKLAGEPAPALVAADTVLLHLDPFESALLAEDDRAPADTRRPAEVRLDLAGTWSMRPLAANALRLGHWWLRLTEAAPDTAGGGSPTGDEDRLVTPAPLANQLRQGGFRWRPRVVTGFGEPARLEFGPVLLRYAATFDCDRAVLDGDVGLHLAIEPDSITGRWRLRVNGAAPIESADLAPLDAPIAGCLGVPVAELLRPGSNELLVEVEATSLDDGLRNALYLVGDVGVRVTALPCGEVRGRLVPPARRGAIGDWVGSGLPFYAGTVEYEAGIARHPDGVLRPRPPDAAEVRTGFAVGSSVLPARPAAWPVDPAISRQVPGVVAAEPAGATSVTVRTLLPPGCADAVEIAFGDGPWHPLPWSPRRADVTAAELATGTVRVRVSTGLARLFEGRWFDPVTHRYQAVGTTEAQPGGGDAARPAAATTTNRSRQSTGRSS